MESSETSLCLLMLLETRGPIRKACTPLWPAHPCHGNSPQAQTDCHRHQRAWISSKSQTRVLLGKNSHVLWESQWTLLHQSCRGFRVLWASILISEVQFFYQIPIISDPWLWGQVNSHIAHFIPWEGAYLGNIKSCALSPKNLPTSDFYVFICCSWGVTVVCFLSCVCACSGINVTIHGFGNI